MVTEEPKSIGQRIRQSREKKNFNVQELAKLDKPEVPVKIFHMKPQYLEEISAELASCQKHCLVLDGNERFVF